ISGSDNGTLRLWNAETGASIGSSWEGHTYPIQCVAFLPDGTRVISAALDDPLRLWDVASGVCIRQSETCLWDVRHIALSPDGSKFISYDGYPSASLQLWDLTCNPIGAPIKCRDLDDPIITFFEDDISFSTGADETFRISDEGIMRTQSPGPTERQSKRKDTGIMYKDGYITMMNAPRHTFRLPAEWTVEKWVANRAKIALGFHSGQ
ncbi:16367_t:CDS:1, partial [Acaulospora colombiana]